MKTAIRKAVIPVAGLGTRSLPFTKEVPKEFLPIIDTPTIHFIVEEVLSAGIDQIVFVTSKGKVALEDYFDPSPHVEHWLEKRGKTDLLERIKKIGKMCEIISVRQKEPLGLGHAVYCARHITGNEKFAVCLGDEIFPPWDNYNKECPPLKRLVAAAEKLAASVVGVVEVPRESSRSYGMIDVGGKSIGSEPVTISKTVEKPKPEDSPSQYAIIGRYIFEPDIQDCLAQVKPGVGGEIQLTDAMDMLCHKGKLNALRLTGCRYDIGNPVTYLKAQLDLALRRPELSNPVREMLKGL